MAHVDRKQYVKIFGALIVLTALEVGIVYIPGIPRTGMIVALLGMALAKAALVALQFMHLSHETKWLKLTVAIPFSAPALYAVVLISEAAWRLLWPVTS
jgi:cytochrome c oxidase subunit IV